MDSFFLEKNKNKADFNIICVFYFQKESAMKFFAERKKRIIEKLEQHSVAIPDVLLDEKREKKRKRRS